MIKSTEQFYNQESFFLVEIRKGKYNGQKLIKLVAIKIAANNKRMMAVIPEIWFVKYRTAIAIATSTLITLSAEPIFFVISICFLVME